MSDQAEARPFGIWTATALVIGGVIGAGIFVLPSQMAAFGWTGVGAWLLGGGGAIVISLVLASIAAARPDEPGLMAVIGEVLGPIPGVLNGWGSWTSYWCANAYIALTSARYASELWPFLAKTPFHLAVAASVLVAGLTVLNLAGLKTSGRFQVVTVLLKLLPLLVVVLIVAALLLQGGEAFAREAHAPLEVSGLFTATSMAFVAIVGFEAASITAQRVRNPERNVPRATMIGVVLSCLIYAVVCSGIVFALPQANLAASNAPIALFIGGYLGAGSGQAVAAFAVISTVGGLSLWIMLQGEVPLALARAGMLPAWMARTNARDIAVVPMVLASSLTVLVLLIGGWTNGSQLMDFLLLLTAASATWIYAFACLTALVLKVRPVLAALGLLFAASIMYGAGARTVLLSVALMLAALPLYWLARRSAATSAAASGSTAGPPG
jgi:basic amino acid/polyamine antiporter, APA family